MLFGAAQRDGPALHVHQVDGHGAGGRIAVALFVGDRERDFRPAEAEVDVLGLGIAALQAVAEGPTALRNFAGPAGAQIKKIQQRGLLG